MTEPAEKDPFIEDLEKAYFGYVSILALQKTGVHPFVFEHIVRNLNKPATPEERKDIEETVWELFKIRDERKMSWLSNEPLINETYAILVDNLEKKPVNMDNAVKAHNKLRAAVIEETKATISMLETASDLAQTFGDLSQAKKEACAELSSQARYPVQTARDLNRRFSANCCA